MSLFYKKEKEVRELLDRYFDTADQALDTFETTMMCYLDRGPCEDFLDGDMKVHDAESRADDLRVEIEKKLYRHSLLPESRGDILGLLESFDKMPNLAETVTFMIVTQGIGVPDGFKKEFAEFLDCNMNAYRLVRKTVDDLFRDPDSVEGAVGPVDKAESDSDRMERKLIIDVFRSDIDKADKILLRELIERIGDISDAAERVAYRIEIIALKRRI